MLIDQDVNKAPSVSVPFFGQAARTPIAAAALALRRDLPILPIFAQRRPEGGHRIVVKPPLRFAPTGDRNRDIRALTRMCNEAIEESIRKNPAEWVWWHRRWRRKPVPGLDMDSDLN
jgi:KDO2-lipid IV(A) lauroyltransferase